MNISCQTYCLYLLLLIGNSQQVFAQQDKQTMLQWNASWIAVPGSSPTGYGVYLFRKTVSWEKVPPTCLVHVSADNRYKLFINEKLVLQGPARGDLYYWNYETIDIAPYLVAGTNTIAALVWNEGEQRPEVQISHRTAFIMQGHTANEHIINTGPEWKCVQNEAYKPLNGIGYYAYYVSGPGEQIDMHKLPNRWMTNDFDDSQWSQAARAGRANPKGSSDIPGWMLVPSALPQMELTSQRFAAARRSENISLPASFPASKHAITIPANKHVVLLLDQSFLTNAYPVIQFSKGDNASIALIYAESLFNEIPNGPGKKFHKGNRNETEGKFIEGRRDSIISNGTIDQQFISLNYRTYRYIQVSIQTKDAPLVLDDVYSLYTGYPFTLNAAFNSNDTSLNKIFDIGWRTARACAMETYMDCPYYEQLQYVGDTRIQALVSLYNSGDDRLLRNAINQMDHSRIAEGITLSRHPSATPQQIPTFSLWYIGMLHDYWMYRGDSVFIQDKLPGVRGILYFFEKYQLANGSLRNVPYWNFTDWRKDDTTWRQGIAPVGKDGSSSVLDMQLLWAYQLATRLELQLGMPAMAAYYQAKANQLSQTIQRDYWDTNTGLYADTHEKHLYSQHANALAILTGLVKQPTVQTLAHQLLTDQRLASASIYFKYYVHQALIMAGLGNDYLKWLDTWRDNIAMGLTTWAEISNIDKSRSDCHAWGSSPNIEFIRTVLGIDTDAPGFMKVKIEPHPGALTQLSGKMPHPAGAIAVHYQLVDHAWNIEIELPATITGKLLWQGKEYPLHAGKNQFKL